MINTILNLTICRVDIFYSQRKKWYNQYLMLEWWIPVTFTVHHANTWHMNMISSFDNFSIKQTKLAASNVDQKPMKNICL